MFHLVYKRYNHGITVWFSLIILNTGSFNFTISWHFLWNNLPPWGYFLAPIIVIVQTNLKLLYDSIVSGFCNVNFASFRPFLIFLSSLGQCLNSKALSHMTHCAKVEIDSVNSEKMMKMWRVKCQNNDKCWTKIVHLDLVI